MIYYSVTYRSFDHIQFMVFTQRETRTEKPVRRMNISALVSGRYISLAQAPLTFIYSALKFTVANFEAEEKLDQCG